MPSAFNDAAKVVIDAWRVDMNDEPTNEEVLTHVLNTVALDEVQAEIEQQRELNLPVDRITAELYTLLNGPHQSVNGLTYRPSTRELLQLVELVTIPGEPVNVRVNELTQLQRLWIYYAREGLLFAQGENPN